MGEKFAIDENAKQLSPLEMIASMGRDYIPMIEGLGENPYQDEQLVQRIKTDTQNYIHILESFLPEQAPAKALYHFNMLPCDLRLLNEALSKQIPLNGHVNHVIGRYELIREAVEE